MKEVEGAVASLLVCLTPDGSGQSGFEPWPGTLCCVLGQDTLLLQCLSPPTMGTDEFNSGGNPAMD